MGKGGPHEAVTGCRAHAAMEEALGQLLAKPRRVTRYVGSALGWRV